ncbi:MAG: hypothetical protein JWN62_518 [Acidimicrobiales bacterium]|nr:hypothetical protein [Acidimicrobiales bacterium]
MGMVMEIRPDPIRSGHPLERLTDEAPSYLEARRRRVDRAALRAGVLRTSAERVAVAIRIHLLPPDVEQELRDQLDALDDRLAVLRHCDPMLDPRCNDMLEHATLLRERVDDQLATFVCDIDVAVGRSPRAGNDWTAAGVPTETFESVQREFAELRRLLVEHVDRIVDSGLLRLIGGREVADCILTAFDADSVEQVRAFVTAVQHVHDEAEQTVLWLRLAALAITEPEPRASIANDEVRRARARSDLDLLRSRQAALAELTDPPS